MNSICSNQSKGWLCIRVEHLEKIFEQRHTSAHRKKSQNTNSTITTTNNKNITATTNWCSGADDWGGDEFGSGGGDGGGGNCGGFGFGSGGDGDDDTFDTNTISSNQHLMMMNQQQQQQQELDDNLNEQNGNTIGMCNNMAILGKIENRNHQSDDEDESNSMDDPIPMFNNLQVIDERNANCGEQQGL